MIAVTGLLLMTTAGAIGADTDKVAPLIKTLRSVESEGKGNQAAADAWRQLAEADAAELPRILAGLDGASPLAANWLHAAVDAIAERQVKAGGKLPAAELEAYLRDRAHNPRGRRLAFDWLARTDSTAPDRWIPQMLDDPSLELRRDAVARLLDEAAKLAKDKNQDAAAVYLRALNAARDLDQVKLASDELKKLGRAVDLPTHFGFVMDWQLVGPFDNKDKKGFPIVYPPEQRPGAKIDRAATFDAGGMKLKWVEHLTADEYGHVDLNKVLGKHMGVVGYAYAEFVADAAQNVELRLGCEDANKVWLNGELLTSAEVYHSNVALDQYVGRGKLKPGVNVILLKICQNEQKDDWAQDWKFQLRVCDSTGTAVLSKNRPSPSTTAENNSKSGAKP
jgi:hypothetical protein